MKRPKRRWVAKERERRAHRERVYRGWRALGYRHEAAKWASEQPGPYINQNELWKIQFPIRDFTPEEIEQEFAPFRGIIPIRNDWRTST